MIYNGETLRDRPRLNVLEGWHGNEPQGLTKIAAPAAGEGIKSGMAIVLNVQGEWEKATDPTADAPVFYAFQDQTDVDVVNSGVLLGLSSLGVYKLETAQFEAAAVFTEGNPVTVSIVVGQEGRIAPTTWGSGDVVVGVCDKVVENLGSTYSEAYFKPGVDNTSVNLNVVTISTKFDPLNGAVGAS